jgi:hypothetical protein
MPDDAMVRSPAWMPKDGEPPLGISQAIRVSLEWATGAYERFDAVEVSKITLQRLSCTGQRNRWFYFVEFTPMMAGNRMYGSGNWAAVLMDGTVVGVQTLD